MNHQYLGSNFGSFLEEEGMFAEVEAAAIKKLIALHVQAMMKSIQRSKSAMAKKMFTSRSVVEKPLDAEDDFVTLKTLEKAAVALGKN